MLMTSHGLLNNFVMLSVVASMCLHTSGLITTAITTKLYAWLEYFANGIMMPGYEIYVRVTAIIGGDK